MRNGAMRQTIKFLHTVSSCGLLGGLVVYGLALMRAPQASASQYADMRQVVSAIADYVIMPSLGIALVTGLVAMMVHRPYQERRWVWVKALLGLAMFEATLAVVQSKAAYAARVSQEIAAGTAAPADLAEALSAEWTTLGALIALSIAQVALGVWRPSLKRRKTAAA